MSKIVQHIALCVLLCSVAINAASVFSKLDTGAWRVGKAVATVGADVFFSAGLPSADDTSIYKYTTSSFPTTIDSLLSFNSTGSIEAVFNYKMHSVEYIGVVERLATGRNFTVLEPATLAVRSSYLLALKFDPTATITGGSGLYDMGFILTIPGDWEECIYNNVNDNVTCYERSSFKQWVGVTGDQTIGFSVFYIKTVSGVDVFVGDRIDGSDDNDVNFPAPNGQNVVGGVAWESGALFYTAPSGGQTQGYILSIAPPTTTTSPLNFTLNATVSFTGDLSAGQWVVDAANRKAYYLSKALPTDITVQILDLATAASVCPLVIAGPVPQPDTLFIGAGSVFIGSSPIGAASINSGFYQTSSPLLASAELACIPGNVTVVATPTVAPSVAPTVLPTGLPTSNPTPAPNATVAPTPTPTRAPNATAAPTAAPTTPPATTSSATLTTVGIFVVSCVLLALF